ncbi:MAG: hypothetical protein M0Q01_16520, partial [Syntrophales bacterium]|nr:hypothetical protein [Syntrophales bacterium]
MNNGNLKRNTVYIHRTKEHAKKAISFAEKSASGCGLGKQEALSLVLAVEEIFFYLCHNAGPGQNVEILST